MLSVPITILDSAVFLSEGLVTIKQISFRSGQRTGIFVPLIPYSRGEEQRHLEDR